MNARNLGLTAALVLPVLLLSACGGSTDDGAGSPVAFSVAPNAKTLTNPVPVASAVCASGYAGDFLIIGGVAPYRLTLSDPQYVSVSTNLITNRNGIFSVTFLTTACLSKSSVTIMDALGNVTTLTLTSDQVVIK